MKHKELYLSLLLILFFGIDAFYWYGYDEDITLVVKYPLLFLLVSFFGFIFLYFVKKESSKQKITFDILITLGVLLNVFLIVTWYIFKDFGF